MPLTCLFHDGGRIRNESLQASEGFVSRLQNFRVGLNKLREVAEEAMGWFEEVKLGVSLLPLSEALQEFLPISSHKLSCELNNVRVNICQHWMTYDILVRGIWAHIPCFPPLLRITTIYRLANLSLVQVFTGFE